MKKTLLLFLLSLCATSVFAQRPMPVASYMNAQGKLEYLDFKAGIDPQIVTIRKEVVVDYQCVPNPGNPPAGNIRVYCDSGTGNFTCLTSTGASCSSSGGGTVTAVTATPPLASSGGTTPNITSGTLPNSPSPSSAYTFFMSSSPDCLTPVSSSGTTVCARNNLTSAIDYSGSDVGPVWTSVVTALATVGGHLFFKNHVGGYPANSATLETATGCSNFASSGNALGYVLGIPSNTPFSSAVEWVIEGEAGGAWQGEAGSVAANTSGTYINVTSTAISSVAANSFIAGFFQRPVTNCNLASSNASNSIVYKNIGIRFPTNTRGNEGGFVSWFTAAFQYRGTTIADFALPYNTIATGSAPVAGTVGSFGFTSSVSSAGNDQHFENSYAVGWRLGYDFQSEHIIGDVVTAIYCNNAAQFGRSGGNVYHPSRIRHFIDQENLNGVSFGSQMQQGSRVDFDSYDLELGSSNWYARTTGAWTETNSGYTNGVISYSVVLQNTGLVGLPSLFSSGGSGFQLFEGTHPANLAQTPASDSFTRPNASTLGPAWVTGTQVGNVNFKIVSNSAQVSAAGLTGAYQAYGAQTFSNDQFSVFTINTINASANSFAEVLVRMSTNPAVQTYYGYYCGGTAAVGRGIFKSIAGVSTTLQSQTSAGCSGGDVIELDVIGTTLIAYRNGVLDNTLTNPTTDSSITSGAPGMNMQQSATGVISLTNFSGGSLKAVLSTTTGAVTGYTH